MSAIDGSDEIDGPTYAVPPVERAIRVLQAISDGESVSNLKQAAATLGINRTTLLSRMKKLGINPRQFF